MIARLRALWNGDIPLGQAFWEYAIAYGTVANILASVGAIVATMLDLSDVLAIGLFFSAMPYILAAAVGVFRSASKYRGPPERAMAAKIAVVAWAALMFVV